MIVPTDGIVQIEAEIIVTVWFTEPPGYDGGSAVWDWGDGSFTVQDDVTSPAQATHAYSEAGTFTIVVTVTDDSTGLSDTGTYEFIIVYDPIGGNPDTFRIRIWWEPTEDIEDPIYDSPDNHPIGGGSIVVQKGKGK